MHELSVIDSILKVVIKHAEKNNVSKVVAVHLEVGELSDLEDKWMQQYFDHLAKNSIAKDALLVIERIPVTMKCNDCGTSYIANIKQDKTLACPDCGSQKNTLVSGRGYLIKNLEVI
jgi:hydrogenase nickel incorporation protein HypA/HybF